MGSDQSLSLPIAENFHSLQGEGVWTGTPMHFIRLAGCSVGENVAVVKQDGETLGPLPILKTGEPAWLCHTYDGRPFWCDTDFKRRALVSFTDLLDATWEKHICLTGGEPLMHMDRVNAFYDWVKERDILLHIETSGTIMCVLPQDTVWVSVSPKLGALPEMIESADEIKLLVDEHFDLDKVPLVVKQHQRVYVQPINDELMVSRANFERCMTILRKMPYWRLSVQTHKLLGLR